MARVTRAETSYTTVPVFVDSNVLVYNRDASEPEKQPLARAWLEYLWRHHEGRLSYQVLQEYYVTVTRKLSPGLPRAEAQAEISRLLTWRPVRPDERVLSEAFELGDRCALSFWDALIVSAARSARCSHLLTEDLTDGQDLGGVVVVDPFRHAPGTTDQRRRDSGALPDNHLGPQRPGHRPPLG